MAQVIDGKERAKQLRKELKGRVSEFTEQAGHPPGWACSSWAVIRPVRFMCVTRNVPVKRWGFVLPSSLPDNATQEQVEEVIDQLNADPHVHGILLQLPLPAHLDAEPLLLRILPEKDADGFHPVNVGHLAVGQPTFVPCTPLGCIDLLRSAGVEMSGAEAVVVGRSNIVGKPAARLLLAEGATVTILSLQNERSCCSCGQGRHRCRSSGCS